MKTRLFSLFCAAALMVSLAVPAAADFSDVTDPDTALAAAALEGMGVIGGYGDGTYRPEETLTRAQFCKIAVLAMGLSDQVASASRRTLFSDVPAAHWAAGYVNLAYSKEIINGYGNGTFGPDDPVTYGQVATILLRMLGYATEDVGDLWPADYVDFAADLGLSEGMSLSGAGTVTRGQAAVLLLRTLQSEDRNGEAYTASISNRTVSSALLLDNDATADDGGTHMAKVYISGAISYYDQDHDLPDRLVGSSGTLLLTASGDVWGFVPDDAAVKDVTVESVSASGITTADGSTYPVPASAGVIYRGEHSSWATGYVDVKSGAAARLYFDETGTVTVVYLPGSASTAAAVATGSNPTVATIASALGLSGSSYKLYKNGASAESSDLAQYDVATYDAAAGALMVSDYKITGAVEDVYPSMDAASTVTVCGAEFTVLEQAQSSLSGYSVGETVTLLLTEDLQVAAVYAPRTVRADMAGILSEDGNSVTLTSGVVLTGEISASESMRGGLVTVTSSGKGSLTASAFSGSASGTLDADAETLGNDQLAPGVAVYEWAGAGMVSRIALSDLKGNTVPASAVSAARLNSAGQVDLLLLKNVTGDCYTYGFAVAGVQQGGSGSLTYQNYTVAVENSDGTTETLVSGTKFSDGTAVGVAATGAGKLAGYVTLKKITGVERDDFDGSDYVLAGGSYYPISSNVQVYNEDTERWCTLAEAKAYGTDFTVYADEISPAGGQIRLIVVS